MVVRTRDVAVFAHAYGLIGCAVVLAIIDSVAHLSLGNTSRVLAGKFSLVTRRIAAVLFICPVSAVILVITLPGTENTSPVSTTELGWLASVKRAVVRIFISIITAIVIAVAGPQSGDALAVAASELVAVARSDIACDAHFPLVDGSLTVQALADGLLVWTGVTRL